VLSGRCCVQGLLVILNVVVNSKHMHEHDERQAVVLGVEVARPQVLEDTAFVQVSTADGSCGSAPARGRV
jgi:hypothetical protein